MQVRPTEVAASTITTPGWLWRGAIAIAILAILAGGVTWRVASAIEDAARTIGQDAEPSVALALGISATLADMDAAAIGDALTDPAAAGTSRAFRDGTARLTRDLVEAARNVTYGEAEAVPLRALHQALAMYQEAIADGRWIGAGDPLITSRRVQWASRVNRGFAAPAAKDLADANADVLEDRWRRYQASWSLGAAAGVACLGLLALALLLLQGWLLRRMRRLVNPPLAAATLVCVATTLWFATQAIGAHATLRTAKQDAYDSLRVLFEAKASVNAIRAAGSLWLFDPASRTEAQARIDQATTDLTGPTRDPAQSRALGQQLQSAIEAERAGNAARALSLVPKTGGSLGTELANITFGLPERQAATDAVTRLLAAADLTRSVQAQAARDRPDAVARWLSATPGGGAAAFTAVGMALDRTIAVNQGAFDAETARILSQVRLVAPVTLGALLAVVALASAGLWLRLREYR